MDVDESFVTYVDARWSALFRLAVLLVDQTSAEDLTQAALLRAYRSWGRVRDADSPDAYVRKILVNCAIDEGRKVRRLPVVRELDVASPEDAVVDRDALWARISTLAPRQRAVIVLRYYEDLTEAEIARVLDCAPGTVKAHAAAGLKALRVSLGEAAEQRAGGDRHG